MARRRSGKNNRPSESDPSHRSQDESPLATIEVLPPDLREQLKDKPQVLAKVEEQIKLLRISAFRSDWPPADILKDYAEQDRQTIMKAVKDRTEAAVQRDKKDTDSAILRMERGQIFGFVIALSSIGGAVYLGTVANFWTAIIAVALVAIGIGGPSVARIIADRFYLRGTEQPPPPPPKQRNR